MVPTADPLTPVPNRLPAPELPVVVPSLRPVTAQRDLAVALSRPVPDSKDLLDKDLRAREDTPASKALRDLARFPSPAEWVLQALPALPWVLSAASPSLAKPLPLAKPPK